MATYESMEVLGMQAEACPADAAQLLRGVGKINGDGWKDTTKIGEVVYAWTPALAPPYAPGQYPRLGNECGWTASTDQYDFTPATREQAQAAVKAVVDAAIGRTLEGVKGQVAQMLAANVEFSEGAIEYRLRVAAGQMMPLNFPAAAAEACAHDWKITSQRALGAWCKCAKCGATTSMARV